MDPNTEPLSPCHAGKWNLEKVPQHLQYTTRMHAQNSDFSVNSGTSTCTSTLSSESSGESSGGSIIIPKLQASKIDVPSIYNGSHGTNRLRKSSTAVHEEVHCPKANVVAGIRQRRSIQVRRTSMPTTSNATDRSGEVGSHRSIFWSRKLRLVPNNAEQQHAPRPTQKPLQSCTSTRRHSAATRLEFASRHKANALSLVPTNITSSTSTNDDATDTIHWHRGRRSPLSDCRSHPVPPILHKTSRKLSRSSNLSSRKSPSPGSSIVSEDPNKNLNRTKSSLLAGTGSREPKETHLLPLLKKYPATAAAVANMMMNERGAHSTRLPATAKTST